MSQKQPFVQLLRFIAALLVCLFHADTQFRKVGGNTTLADIFETGWLGVSIFFVISGFVMVAGTNPKLNGREFLWRRFARIYPPLWVAIALFIPATLLGWGEIDESGDIFRSLTLLDLSPDADRHAMYTTWTLVFEMMFYLVFTAFIMFGRRHGWAWLLAAAAFVEFCNAIEGVSPGAVPLLLRDRQLYLFMLGCVTGAVYGRVTVARPWLLFLGAGLLVIGIADAIGAREGQFVIMGYVINPRVFVAAATSLLILGSQPIVKWMSNPIWDISGDISYAMYLTHLTVIGGMRAVHLDFWGPLRHLGPMTNMLIYLVAVIVVSIIFQRFIEKPLVRFFQSNSPQFTPPQTAG